jgi:hypothetical protein
MVIKCTERETMFAEMIHDIPPIEFLVILFDKRFEKRTSEVVIIFQIFSLIKDNRN